MFRIFQERKIEYRLVKRLVEVNILLSLTQFSDDNEELIRIHSSKERTVVRIGQSDLPIKNFSLFLFHFPIISGPNETMNFGFLKPCRTCRFLSAARSKIGQFLPLSCFKRGCVDGLRDVLFTIYNAIELLR